MIRIANGCGFWGDSPLASKELLEGASDIDYLTLEYLAELTLAILSGRSVQYCADFLDVVRSLIPFRCKIITNAGGLDPVGLARECKKLVPDKKIGVISSQGYVYLGAKPIVQALQMGADIVITGRVADPSLTVAPCLHHFGWTDWDRIAAATVAGHLLECGAQATGGMTTDWLQIEKPEAIGYPIVEMSEDGSFVLTKPNGSGGQVTLSGVKEQLLYEIADPNKYLSPDATVSFTSLALEQVGKDRVRVTGAKGDCPPDTFKEVLFRPAGYKVEAMLALYGRNCREKALKAGKSVIDRVRGSGYSLAQTRVETLGLGDVVPFGKYIDAMECVLRIAAFDPDPAGLQVLAKEIAPLVTRGPQGITGYATGRPKVRQAFWLANNFVPCSQVRPNVEIL